MTNARSSRVAGVLMIFAMVPLLAMGFRSGGRSRDRVRAAHHWADKTVWDSVYTTAQAGRGETAYAKTCGRCHGATLGGGDESPALTGGDFLGNWNGLPLSDLQKRVKTTMPSDSVGIYDLQLVTDVMAFILKVNGFPAGQLELPKDADSLKAIMMQTSRK